MTEATEEPVHRHAHCLWSVPASVLCCIFLSVVVGGATILNIVKLFNIGAVVDLLIFAVLAVLVAFGVGLLAYLYFHFSRHVEQDVELSVVHEELPVVSDGLSLVARSSMTSFSESKILRSKVCPVPWSTEPGTESWAPVLLNVRKGRRKSLTTVKEATLGSKMSNGSPRTSGEEQGVHLNQLRVKEKNNSVISTTSSTEVIVKQDSMLDRIIHTVIPRMHDYEHAYTRFCVCVLGLGSLVYYVLLTYNQFSTTICPSTLPGLGPILIILFIIAQAWLFVDPFHVIEPLLENLRNRADWVVVAVRYSFMIFFATDLTLWIYAVVTEAYEDYCENLLHHANLTSASTVHTTSATSSHSHASGLCSKSAGICYNNTFTKANEYLVPLVAEFGLFMCQALVAWFRDTIGHTKCLCEPQPENLSVLRQGKWGIFAGLIVLAGQLASFIVYERTRDEFPAEVGDGIFCLLSIAASIAMLVLLNRLKLKPRNDSVHFEEIVHLMFLLMTYVSTIIYFGVNIIQNLFLKYRTSQSIVQAIVNLIQPIDGTFQVIVVWIVTFKEGSEVKKDSKLISLMIFLFFQSLTIWVAASYRYVHVSKDMKSAESGDMFMYTLMITHVTVPMIIYFRFQLAETWNHFYT